MDKTLLKGLSLLETLAEMKGESHSIEAIMAEVGLTRSNTHRTLQTLVQAGYVERDPVRGGYRHTLKMLSIAVRQMGRLDVRQFAQPMMAALAHDTEETVHLSVLDGLDVIYIDKIDSTQPIRSFSMIGGRTPAHAVATGKALLAAQGPAYLQLHANKLQCFTDMTVTDLASLQAELAKAARHGYAINRGEWRSGEGGVAAPVFNGMDRVVAALGVSGPIQRFSLARIKELAPRVVAAAAAASRSMGHQPKAAPAAA